MAMVQGEDSESDEEINTEHLQSLVLTPDGSLTGYRGLMKGISAQKTAGIVMGEDDESETDEEGEEDDKEPVDQPDSASGEQADVHIDQDRHSDIGSVQDVSKQQPVDPSAPAPQSLLHKKLRERNQSLRKNVADRIIKLYRITCRNLTLVNNNLSKAQGTIETVNSNLKRSEHELSELNSIISDINIDARAVAPTLSILLPQGTKKSPSPITQKLLMGAPKVYNLLTASSNSKQSPVSRLPDEHQEFQVNLPEARLEASNSGKKVVENTIVAPQIPEAQPGRVDT